jgi:hypothetical protein
MGLIIDDAERKPSAEKDEEKPSFQCSSFPDSKKASLCDSRLRKPA